MNIHQIHHQLPLADFPPKREKPKHHSKTNQRNERRNKTKQSAIPPAAASKCDQKWHQDLPDCDS
ncbi:hypothetical protein HKD37_10G027187 [Glycine soja]